jgi:hypothetical protein
MKVNIEISEGELKSIFDTDERMYKMKVDRWDPLVQAILLLASDLRDEWLGERVRNIDPADPDPNAN